MRDVRSSLGVKCAACLLFVACLTGAVFAWGYCALNWDRFFFYEDSMPLAYEQELNRHYYILNNVLSNRARMEDGENLNYLEQKSYEENLANLAPESTNFRYVVRDYVTGEEVYASRPGAASDGEGEGSGPEIAYSATRVMELWKYEGPSEADLTLRQYVVEYGVDPALPVGDELAETLRNVRTADKNVIWLAAGLTAGTLALAIFLCVCAGHRRGEAGIRLNWQDRIPMDLYICLSVGAIVGTGTLAVASADSYIFHPAEIYTPYVLALGLGATAACAAFILAALLTLVARLKSRTLLSNTYVWRILRWIGRQLARLGRWWGVTFGSWPITKRVVLLFLGYLLGTVLTTFTVALIPFYQGAVLFLLCRWVREWKRIRAGTAAIVGGAPDTVIDLGGMRHFPDLAEHAVQLNDLGSAINSAVEERMKSERMKAELITNVSHDLKTPLTSIINYVDLLKKEDIQEGKAQEYLEVLDRKSQRLKKLTEDLVEASKASTGTLTVERERLNLAQLVRQGLGEYEEKLAARNLTMVADLPEEPLYALADGRHLWRVLDNLLGNCAKYAMEGTRVYLALARWDGHALLTVKNISADPLNIPADQLMERFVRGEESRTTEGSGLGLSIARSLTELQGGSFSLSIDGDLFKATVRLPEAP